MKKAVLLLLVAIITVLAVGCQKSKSDNLSEYSFTRAKQYVAICEKFLDGDLPLETTQKKLNKLDVHFIYGEPEKGENSTAFSIIGSDMAIIYSELDDADNYDEDAIKDIKENLEDIKSYIYQ